MTETQLQSPIHEKIYKKVFSRSGKTVFTKKLIGHIVAGVIDNKVAIGYSLVHKRDFYDVIKGKRIPGHGKNLATIRAIKWKDSPVITVPPKIEKQMTKFAHRCDLYYKDRERIQMVKRAPMPNIPASCQPVE